MKLDSNNARAIQDRYLAQLKAKNPSELVCQIQVRNHAELETYKGGELLKIGEGFYYFRRLKAVTYDKEGMTATIVVAPVETAVVKK